jgi:hypothetical protein
MGLQVTLDAHTDLLDAFSIESNYDSFTVLVSPSGDFPLTNQRGFRVWRGHHTLVALTATIINADPSLRSIDPYLRGCMFPDEYQLKLYKNYSQANCLFECTLNYAQKVATSDSFTSNSPCTPWYYPFIDKEQLTCDPYATKVRLSMIIKLYIFINRKMLNLIKEILDTYLKVSY